MRIVWDRFFPPLHQVAIIQDNQGVPIAAVLDPRLARPIAAILESLDGSRDDSVAGLAHYLAQRLGLGEDRVREALEWASRRAGVEIVPDRVIVCLREGGDG